MAKQIAFNQLCALVRAVIQREPTIDDAEWKARTLDQLGRWRGFEPVDPAMLDRAMTHVEHAVRRTLGPRPTGPLVATPAPAKPARPEIRFEGRTNRPLGWDRVQALIAKLQRDGARRGDGGRTYVAREVAITETIALREFWRQAEEPGADRVAILRTFAEIAIIRSPRWKRERIRAQVLPPQAATCFACRSGRIGRAWHHVIQVQHGGSNHPRNRVTLCPLCHSDVHPWLDRASRTVSGWVQIGAIGAAIVQRERDAV